MPDSYTCPKCGQSNPPAAQFCIQCHALLIRRCPNCWHEQREGLVCEKCGTCFALAAELALEKAQNEESRLERDKFIAGALTFLQIVALPFTTVGGLLRGLVLRAVTGFLNR